MKLNKFLIASKICDTDGRFSHTSLLLLVAIARLAFFPADAYTVAILTLALAHANAKRYKAHKQQQHDTATKGIAAQDRAAIELLQADIKRIESTNSLKNLSR